MDDRSERRSPRLAAFEHARLAEVVIGPSYRKLARWYKAFSGRPSAKA